jgi:hypothetical protein
MASIETRKTKGKITRYRVKWRTGGTRDGAGDGTTFDAHADGSSSRRGSRSMATGGRRPRF